MEITVPKTIPLYKHGMGTIRRSSKSLEAGTTISVDQPFQVLFGTVKTTIAKVHGMKGGLCIKMADVDPIQGA